MHGWISKPHPKNRPIYVMQSHLLYWTCSQYSALTAALHGVTRRCMETAISCIEVACIQRLNLQLCHVPTYAIATNIVPTSVLSLCYVNTIICVCFDVILIQLVSCNYVPMQSHLRSLYLLCHLLQLLMVPAPAVAKSGVPCTLVNPCSLFSIFIITRAYIVSDPGVSYWL